MSFYKEVPGRKTTLESALKFDTEPMAGSTNPVTSEGVKTAIDGAVGDAAEALQDQIDDIAEKAGSGYTPKGEATVATLNAISGQENGELYTMTDSGTLTDGSLAVVAGDTVAWDGANSVWYKAMDYAPRQYGTNEVHNLANEATSSTLDANQYAVVDGSTGTFKAKLSAISDWIHGRWASFVNALTAKTSFASGDKIAVVNGSTATAMGKDTLLAITAKNALESIHLLNDTATEDDLVGGNYLVLDGIAGTPRLPAELLAKRRVQVVDGEKIKIALANTQAIEAMFTLRCRLSKPSSTIIWDNVEPLGHYGCIISVHAGDVVRIVPTTACMVAFLKSTNNIGFAGGSADVSTATGFDSLATIYSEQTYTIPSDVNYLYFTTILNHVSYVPTISVNGVSINEGSLSSLGRLIANGVYKDIYNNLVVQNNAQTLIWSPVLTTATDLQQFMNADLSDTGGDFLAMVQHSNDGVNFNAPGSLTWSASIKNFWSKISQTYFRIIIKRNDGGVLSNSDIWVKDVEGSLSVAVPRIEFELGKTRTNWKGKKWVAFGTSISDSGPNGNAGVIPPTGLYPKYLTALSGLKHKNWAYGGSSWTYNDGSHPTYLERLTAAITAGDVATADIITVDGCVNDFTHGSPIGVKTDSVTNTICGAINNFVASIRAVNQHALIVFIADSTGKEYNGNSECVYTTTKNVVDGGETRQYTQSDYIAAMKLMADYIGVKFINAGPTSGINKFTPDYIKDHIHHTEKGGQQFANAIWYELQTIQPSIV